MVINRNAGWPNLDLGGALTKSGDKERSTQGDESKSPRGASLFVLSLHKDFPALSLSPPLSWTLFYHHLAALLHIHMPLLFVAHGTPHQVIEMLYLQGGRH